MLLLIPLVLMLQLDIYRVCLAPLDLVERLASLETE